MQSMFRNESEHRPGAALRAEDVLAALEKRTDARFLEARQHLAQPFRARYCKGAKVAHELAISICEYDDAAAAKAGREVSLRSLASIPDRQIAVNGATTLTLRQTKKTAASAELADRLVTAFAELKK